MNFSVVQIAIVLSVPLLLTLLVSWRCSRAARPAMIGASFLLGALFLVPIARCSNFVTLRWPDLTGHFYFDELIGNFLTTAIPEELGKGLAALIVLKFTRSANSPWAWLACGAAAHSGFAAIEGLLGSLGNEGVLKVLIGRSLGTLSHVSWGIIAAWFLCRGSFRHSGRWANWSAAFFIPALLHALTNASMVEVPGAANLPDDAAPPPEAILIMLSGMAALIVSLSAAIGCLIDSTRTAPLAGNIALNKSIEPVVQPS